MDLVFQVVPEVLLVLLDLLVLLVLLDLRIV